MIWLGIIIAVIAGSRTEVWTVAIDVGYAMLSGGIVMKLAGAVCLGLYQLSFHRAG